MGSRGTASGKAAAREDEILERSAEFYASVLWSSETGNSVRARLADAEISAKTLRQFQVGYAPVQPRELLDHLAEWRYSTPDLVEAGVVTRSGSRYLHARFHSRIMFPIRDRAGGLLGFAGLATHLGPSWPLWLVSPDRGRFQRGAALFGIERAAAAIAKTGRAKVLNDCLEVLRLHEVGEKNAVAVVQSPITETHLELLAAELSLAREELATSRLSSAGNRSKSLTVVGAEAELEKESAAPRSTLAIPIPLPAKPAEMIVREGEGADDAQAPPEPSERPAPWHRLLRALGATAVGAGLPLVWLGVVSPSKEASGGRGVGFVLVALGVAASYGLLAIVAARVSARARARSAERRMRAPYLHGATEWQPPAWTYHRIEDLLIHAAIVSMVILVALFMTIGGFTGWNTSTAAPWPEGIRALGCR